jgi:hypothetical protein
MTHYKLDRDINGNKICKITVPNERGFSIQTNGNLPETDRNGICNATPNEVFLYVKNFGTKRQKEILGF